MAAVGGGGCDWCGGHRVVVPFVGSGEHVDELAQRRPGRAAASRRALRAAAMLSSLFGRPPSAPRPRAPAGAALAGAPFGCLRTSRCRGAAATAPSELSDWCSSPRPAASACAAAAVSAVTRASSPSARLAEVDPDVAELGRLRARSAPGWRPAAPPARSCAWIASIMSLQPAAAPERRVDGAAPARGGLRARPAATARAGAPGLAADAVLCRGDAGGRCRAGRPACGRARAAARRGRLRRRRGTDGARRRGLRGGRRASGAPSPRLPGGGARGRLGGQRAAAAAGRRGAAPATPPRRPSARGGAAAAGAGALAAARRRRLGRRRRGGRRSAGGRRGRRLGRGLGHGGRGRRARAGRALRRASARVALRAVADGCRGPASRRPACAGAGGRRRRGGASARAAGRGLLAERRAGGSACPPRRALAGRGVRPAGCRAASGRPAATRRRAPRRRCAALGAPRFGAALRVVASRPCAARRVAAGLSALLAFRVCGPGPFVLRARCGRAARPVAPPVGRRCRPVAARGRSSGLGRATLMRAPRRASHGVFAAVAFGVAEDLRDVALGFGVGRDAAVLLDGARARRCRPPARRSCCRRTARASALR